MKEKILIVDDDPAVIRLVCMILEKQGYSVSTANSGEEAFQLAFSFQPDLIILDVHMPGGWSGFVTCKKLKTTPEFAPIPIIFLTAKVEQFEEGFEFGGADYVLKPFNQKELVVRTQFHLKMRNLVKQVQQSNESLEHKVQARTQDLTNANSRLSQVINERKVLESRLKHETGTDFLTHLSSGVAFENNLQAMLDSNDGSTHDGALLYVDLVKFESINQRYGWNAGDEVLIEVSKLLQSQLGSAAFLSRPGGDQFAIYVKKANAATAKTIARGLVDCINSYPFTWQAHSIEINAYIGFCLVSNTELNARDLVSRAIQATISSKVQGAGSVVGYHQSVDNQDSVQHAQNWVRQVELALESNDFSLFVQKVQPLSESTNQLISLEVLLRLKTMASERLILPSEIFGFSENNQIKSKIDFWATKEVLKWLGKNQQVTSQYSHISLNLTAETIANPMFLITLENLLANTSIAPSFICFEISEPTILHSIDRSRAFLSRLKTLGCLTCIDDFGGQNALYQHLNHLEVDYLKIDGTFIKHFTNSSINTPLYKMLKEVAKLTNSQLIAKHVEDEGALKKLQDIGIEYAQGFYLHTPESLDNLAD